jgi:hypothetical protein
MLALRGIPLLVFVWVTCSKMAIWGPTGTLMRLPGVAMIPPVLMGLAMNIPAELVHRLMV